LKPVNKAKILPFLVALAIVGLDQLTKFLVMKNLVYGHSYRLIGEVLKLTYVKNPDTLFSISLGPNFPYITLGFVLIAVLVVLILHEKQLTHSLIYGLLLGGAAGNIIDRLRIGEVVDFIDVGISPTLRWPVFNLADSAITIGLIIYFIIILKGVKKGENT